VPTEVGEGTALTNKIVDQHIVGFFEPSIKDCRKSQPVVPVCFGVCYPVKLHNSYFQAQIELLSQASAEDTRNGIHPSRFNSMYRE